MALQAALAFTPEMLKRTMAARMPRMAMTTRSSTSVNPPWPGRSCLLASAERFTLISALIGVLEFLRVVDAASTCRNEIALDGAGAVASLDDEGELFGRGGRLVEQVARQEFSDVDVVVVRRAGRKGDVRGIRIEGLVVVVEVDRILNRRAVGLHRVAASTGIHAGDVEEDDGRQDAKDGDDDEELDQRESALAGPELPFGIGRAVHADQCSHWCS